MACNCPDAVTQILRKTVRKELNKVRAILSSSKLFDTAVGDVIGLADTDVSSAVDQIPAATPLGLSDIAEYLACPLTPLALGLGLVDLQSLTPDVLMSKLKGLKEGDVVAARDGYESALTSSDHYSIIKMARDFVRELTRLKFDAASFTNAVVISVTVLQVCGQEEYQAGPYADFAAVVQGFSMDGGVPSTLSNNTAAVVQKLLDGEAKLKALRDALN